MYFEIYQEKLNPLSLAATGGQWRWRLKAANHEPIASGESYHNKQDCLKAISLVQGTSTSTPVKEL